MDSSPQHVESGWFGASLLVLGGVRENSTYENALVSRMVTLFELTPLLPRPGTSTKKVGRPRIKHVDHQRQEQRPETVVQRPRSEFNILVPSTLEHFDWNPLDEIEHEQAFRSNKHDSYF